MAASRPLDGRRALITGSTSGIGLGIANRLAAEGAEIFLNGRGEPDEIERSRAAIEESHGVKAAFLEADLRNADQISTMMAEAERRGGVDILVNNAGITFIGPIESHPLKRWEAIMAVNVTAAYLTIAAALPAMRERGWGRIVNTSSALGLTALPNRAAYVASKHALIGLTKVAALEAVDTGVTCNAICPGLVDTPAIRSIVGRRAEAEGRTPETVIAEMLAEMQPGSQLVQIEQIAALVAFLCSDGAASITGAEHKIDRGWVAR